MGIVYSPDALAGLGGGYFALREDFRPHDHRVEVVITDDDTHLDGDFLLNELGDDADQTATVRDMDGNLVASGRIYSEFYYELTGPGGTKIYLDTLEIGGQVVGYVPSAPLEEGVSYQVTASGEVHTALQNLLEGDTRATYSELASVPCFVSGTSVMTTEGMVAVDWLRPGDRLLTRDRGFQPLLWIGRFEPDKQAAGADATAPVTIAPDALGPGLPAAALRLSPQHRLLIQDAQLQLCFGHEAMFCAADFLTGWPGIAREQGAAPVVYYHLLLPRHEAILADGAWAESLFLGDVTQEMLGPDRIADLRRRADLAHGGHDRTAYPCLRRWEAALVQPPAADTGVEEGPARQRA